MALTDASLISLRVFREAVERGTLSAAAAALGYTQSAASRQIAALERAAGTTLLERRHDGVQPTPAGRLVLRRAAVVLDEIDATDRDLSGLPAERAVVRLGWFPSAGAALVPQALAALRRTHPEITVIGREAGTPALVRALRAGTVDLALLAAAPPFRPPDAESPALELRILSERALCVAVPAGDPLALGDAVDIADLRGRAWIAGSGRDGEKGVWPGLDERPTVVHTARDWLAKLRLVAAGCGITTAPAMLAAVAPPGVRILPVRGGPREQRRLLLASLPQRKHDAPERSPTPDPAARVAAALAEAATR